MAIKIASAEPIITAEKKKPVKRIRKAKEASAIVLKDQTSQNDKQPPTEVLNGNKRKGFASMSGEKHKQISSKGGMATTKEKRHFALNPEAARKAGAKGGSISKRKPKVVINAA